MASADERPDLDALRELEDVLRHLAEELSSWRRRALSAEGRLTDQARSAGPEGVLELREIEDRSRTLEQRLVHARERVSALLGRLDFLEKQALSTEGRGETAKD